MCNLLHRQGVAKGLLGAELLVLSLPFPLTGGAFPIEYGGYPFPREPGPRTLAFRKAFKDLGAACTGCSPQLRCFALSFSPRPPQRSSRHTFRPAPLQACRCRPTPRTPPRRPPPEPRRLRSSRSPIRVRANLSCGP
jgi:hypothetical protein